MKNAVGEGEAGVEGSRIFLPTSQLDGLLVVRQLFSFCKEIFLLFIVKQQVDRALKASGNKVTKEEPFRRR